MAKAKVIRTLRVESWQVRQLAVNLISGDLELITCPQSPATFIQNGIHPLVCPFPSIDCQRVTPVVSGCGGIIAAPVAEKDLTDLLNSLQPPAGFKNMTLNVISSAENRESAVRGIKKAAGAKLSKVPTKAKKAKKAT